MPDYFHHTLSYLSTSKPELFTCGILCKINVPYNAHRITKVISFVGLLKAGATLYKLHKHHDNSI